MPSISEVLRIFRPKEKAPERKMTHSEQVILNLALSSRGREHENALRVAAIVRDLIEVSPNRFTEPFTVDSDINLSGRMDVDYDPVSGIYKETIIIQDSHDLKPSEAFSLGVGHPTYKTKTRSIPFTEAWLTYGLKTYQAADKISNTPRRK